MWGRGYMSSGSFNDLDVAVDDLGVNKSLETAIQAHTKVAEGLTIPFGMATVAIILVAIILYRRMRDVGSRDSAGTAHSESPANMPPSRFHKPASSSPLPVARLDPLVPIAEAIATARLGSKYDSIMGAQALHDSIKVSLYAKHVV